MSRVLKSIILFLARFIIRDRVMASVVRSIGPKDTNTFFSWMYKMKLFNREFEKKVWEGLDLDTIIW